MKNKNIIGILTAVVLIIAIVIAMVQISEQKNQISELSNTISSYESKLSDLQEQLTSDEELIDELIDGFNGDRQDRIEKSEDGAIKVNKEFSNPAIYDENDVYVGVTECSYVEGNETLTLNFEIRNNSSKPITVEFTDAHIGNTALHFRWYDGSKDENTIDVDTGTNSYCAFAITASQLENNNITDFEKMRCTCIIKEKNGDEFASQDVIFYREVFN